MRCPPDLGALRHTATLPTHHTYEPSGQMRVWSQVFGGLWVAEPQIARHVRGRLGPLGSDPTPSTRRRLVQLTQSRSALELWRSVPDRLTDPGHDSTIPIPTPTTGFLGCRSRRPPTCATRPRCTRQCWIGDRWWSRTPRHRSPRWLPRFRADGGVRDGHLLPNRAMASLAGAAGGIPPTHPP